MSCKTKHKLELLGRALLVFAGWLLFVYLGCKFYKPLHQHHEEHHPEHSSAEPPASMDEPSHEYSLEGVEPDKNHCFSLDRPWGKGQRCQVRGLRSLVI